MNYIFNQSKQNNTNSVVWNASVYATNHRDSTNNLNIAAYTKYNLSTIFAVNFQNHLVFVMFVSVIGICLCYLQVDNNHNWWFTDQTTSLLIVNRLVLYTKYVNNLFAKSFTYSSCSADLRVHSTSCWVRKHVFFAATWLIFDYIAQRKQPATCWWNQTGAQYWKFAIWYDKTTLCKFSIHHILIGWFSCVFLVILALNTHWQPLRRSFSLQIRTLRITLCFCWRVSSKIAARPFTRSWRPKPTAKRCTSWLRRRNTRTCVRSC